MRVDEGRNSGNLPVITKNARTVLGRGAKSLCDDPGSEFRLGKEQEKGKVRRQQKG